MHVKLREVTCISNDTFIRIYSHVQKAITIIVLSIIVLRGVSKNPNETYERK